MISTFGKFFCYHVAITGHAQMVNDYSGWTNDTHVYGCVCRPIHTYNYTHPLCVRLCMQIVRYMYTKHLQLFADGYEKGSLLNHN